MGGRGGRVLVGWVVVAVVSEDSGDEASKND